MPTTEEKSVYWGAFFLGCLVTWLLFVYTAKGPTETPEYRDLQSEYDTLLDHDNSETEKLDSCISNLDDLESSVSSVVSDLDYYVDGDYYELQDANESAADTLRYLDFGGY